MKKTLINRIKNGMMKMMLNCKQASFLIDKQEYVDLSKKEKVDLKLHLSTCKHCRNYKYDSELINKIISKSFNPDELKIHLTDEQKQRLEEKLQSQR